MEEKGQAFDIGSLARNVCPEAVDLERVRGVLEYE